jgi:putative tryptophan/tyrosine transport system substrate-binding protein
MLEVRRREIITLLGGAAAWSFAAHAQPVERIRRIGALMAFADGDTQGKARVVSFEETLHKLGWFEGRNIRIDYRLAGQDPETRQKFAAELVATQPDLIFTTDTSTTASVMRQTRMIPIIFVQVSDPIGSGFVSSLNRPGGNATGFMNMEPTIASKWLELLKEIAPRVDKVALLFNPAVTSYAAPYLKRFEAAASSLGVEPIAAPIQQMAELEAVVARARDNSGLLVMPDIFLWLHRAEVISLAARYGLPAIYPQRDFTELGGLLSYGNDRRDQFPRAATYVDRILKGEKPSELPVQAPIKFELLINLKTAKALGLQISDKLIAIADEVIE